MLLTLPTNIRLCWKCLPGTNTLAYYKRSQITFVKRFITFVPENGHTAEPADKSVASAYNHSDEASSIKLFTLVNYTGLVQHSVFVNVSRIQPSLIFEGKAEAHHSEASYKTQLSW